MYQAGKCTEVSGMSMLLWCKRCSTPTFPPCLQALGASEASPCLAFACELILPIICKFAKRGTGYVDGFQEPYLIH